MTREPSWLLYGAYGYSGELIARQAVERGLRPVLGGRREGPVKALAESLGLEWRAFAVDEVGALKAGLDGMNLVLNCAGPFSATAASMIDGCLQLGAHYLDITGEIDVFAHAHAQHDRARSRGLLLCPGVGFDVVPTDCLAALLKRELPEAHSLELAFDAGGGPSRGTALTAVEGLAAGGRIRQNGQLRRVPLAWQQREVAFQDGPRCVVSIPWGDVYTAHLSTGIPDVVVYMAMPPKAIARLRRLRPLRWLPGSAPAQWWLKRTVRQRVSGPDEARRSSSRSQVWGEARSADGRSVSGRLVTPNGYELTAESAVRIAERVLRGGAREGGYCTPSQLMGADFVRSLDGVQVLI
ncbi:MAG: saccharopine dehydrogenase NADP-binding domain-containing protein [Lysobacterales bacterium]